MSSEPGYDAFEQYHPTDTLAPATGVPTFGHWMYPRIRKSTQDVGSRRVANGREMNNTSTYALETILNAGESDKASWDCEGAGQEHVKHGITSKDAEYSTATVLQQVIADDIEQQVEIVLMAIFELVEEAVEQLFRPPALNIQGIIFTLVYDVVEQVLFGQIQTAALEEKIDDQ